MILFVKLYHFLQHWFKTVFLFGKKFTFDFRIMLFLVQYTIYFNKIELFTQKSRKYNTIQTLSNVKYTQCEY